MSSFLFGERSQITKRWGTAVKKISPKLLHSNTMAGKETGNLASYCSNLLYSVVESFQRFDAIDWVSGMASDV